ncbi:MAG: phytase [Hyphomicrobiales bacterium]|nr:phytase [Hyphomicrobiales bacterium]
MADSAVSHVEPTVVVWLPITQSDGPLSGTPTATPTAVVTAVPIGTVVAAVETDPVQNSGDSADDPAIWIHPTDPALSVVIGTNKDAGLGLYDLDGTEIQFVSDGEINNVDLRDGFMLEGQPITLVAGGNRSDNSIAIYKANPETRRLENIAARKITVGLSEPYGACMYASSITGKYYFIANDKRGDVEQWEVFEDGQGKVDATLVRNLSVGSITEGCVADDELGDLYIGEENVAIWKYGAEPDSGDGRVVVDTTGSEGHLTADVEGLAIYDAGNGQGYLIASSQGNDSYVIYRRENSNDYITTFQIEAANGIDAVSGTDGIDVTNLALNAQFPGGLFVVQDGDNGNENQNFKLVSWELIANSVSPPLSINN